MSADAPLLYDWTGVSTISGAAPITGRGNTALASPQGGMAMLGSDYASTAKGQLLKVDQYGNVSVTVGTPGGTAAQVYAGQSAGAASTQYGQLMFGRQDLPAPSSYYPMALDPVGAINVHPKSKPTFRGVCANVTCGTNVILCAFLNGSASSVMRLNDMSIYVPIAGGSSGALLGSSSGRAYYAVICELRRIATYTGGSAITLQPGDTGDTLSSGVTAAKAVTSIGSNLGTFHRADAYCNNMTGVPFYERGDGTAKTMVLRPGEGFALVCLSNGTINTSSADTNTTTAIVDVTYTVTQAAG